jgi:hypothetical protein
MECSKRTFGVGWLNIPVLICADARAFDSGREVATEYVTGTKFRCLKMGFWEYPGEKKGAHAGFRVKTTFFRIIIIASNFFSEGYSQNPIFKQYRIFSIGFPWNSAYCHLLWKTGAFLNVISGPEISIGNLFNRKDSLKLRYLQYSRGTAVLEYV